MGISRYAHAVRFLSPAGGVERRGRHGPSTGRPKRVRARFIPGVCKMATGPNVPKMV